MDLYSPLLAVEQEEYQRRQERELTSYLWLINHDSHVRSEALAYWNLEEDWLQPGVSGEQSLEHMHSLYGAVRHNLNYSTHICQLLDIHVGWISRPELRPQFDEVREVLHVISNQQQNDALGAAAYRGIQNAINAEQESITHMMMLGDSVLDLVCHLQASQLKVYRLSWLHHLVHSNLGDHALQNHLDDLKLRRNLCSQKTDFLAWLCGEFG